MLHFTRLYADLNDEQLFALIARGDKEAFTVVYHKYHKLMYAIAYRYLMSVEQTEDVVQHVFTRLWEFRAELRIGVSLKNYLFTMTKNHVLNLIRNENSVVAKNYEAAQLAPKYEDNLVDKMEEQELITLFYKAIDLLPTQKREICLMKIRDELSNQDIANKLHLSINTIKTHYSESLKLLRTHLTKTLIIVILTILTDGLSVYFTIK